MKKFLPTRRKSLDEKPEIATAVEDAAESSSIEKDASANTSVTTDTPAEATVEYVLGWKLWSLLVGVSSVFILVLLDMSIVATVGGDPEL